jgi:hypothetical protein
MIKFKHEKDKDLFLSLHLALIVIYSDMSLYAKEKHGIDIVITETITTPEQDKKLNRVSTAHQKSIALDWRTNGIDTFVVADIINYINSKEEYKKYHYLSNSGVKRLAYWHNSGHGDHCHLAIHKSFGIDHNKDRLALH